MYKKMAENCLQWIKFVEKNGFFHKQVWNPIIH